MPPIGALGHADFSNLFINLSHDSYPTHRDGKAAGHPTLNYGLFLNSVVNFLIIAFAIFLLLHGQSLAPKARAGRRANHQGLPPVPDGYSHRRKKVRPLHVRCLDFRFSAFVFVVKK